MAPSDPSAGYDARAAAASDLAAMRTPITKDEMRKDGWSEESDGYFKHRTCTVVFPVIYREELNWFTVRVGGVLIRNARTMYDLRELVRLLGGEP